MANNKQRPVKTTVQPMQVPVCINKLTENEINIVMVEVQKGLEAERKAKQTDTAEQKETGFLVSHLRKVNKPET